MENNNDCYLVKNSGELSSLIYRNRRSRFAERRTNPSRRLQKASSTLANQNACRTTTSPFFDQPGCSTSTPRQIGYQSNMNRYQFQSSDTSFFHQDLSPPCRQVLPALIQCTEDYMTNLSSSANRLSSHSGYYGLSSPSVSACSSSSDVKPLSSSPPSLEQYSMTSSTYSTDSDTSPYKERVVKKVKRRCTVKLVVNVFVAKNKHIDPKAKTVLNQWYQQNLHHPYPTEEARQTLALPTGVTELQVKSWFANCRNRSQNTRPRKQKRKIQDRLMDLCTELNRLEKRANLDVDSLVENILRIANEQE